MRFLALCILSFVVAQKGICQYQSFFGKTSTSWNSVGSGLNRVNEWTDSVAYEKDTLLAGVSYKKVSLWRAYPNAAYQSDLLFREDTTTGRLWHRYPDSTNTLIADLSLGVGGQFFHPVATTVALTVDSVYYVNSRKHVRFQNSSLLDVPLIFIEGVGPSHGVLFVSPLLCQYKDGNPNYVLNVPHYPGICNVHELTSIDSHLEIGIRISPNPTTGLIKIESPAVGKDLVVYVYDAIGRHLLTKKYSGGGCEVNLGQLSPGLYMIAIKNSNKLLIKQEKIVLN